MPRTEGEKIEQAPIIAVLGGKEYEIKPLVMRESRKWRGKYAELIGQLPKYMSVTTDTPDEFGNAIKTMLVEVPDQVADLVFDYAPNLNREEIEATATDAEIAKVFQQIMEVAFPLALSVPGAMGKLA